MGIVERSSFFRIQDTYCVDSIKDFWNDKSAEVVSGLQSKYLVVSLFCADNVVFRFDNKPLFFVNLSVFVADGHMDSPGLCAQYCTYNIMENDTKEILSIVNIDKRETQRSSVIMEKQGFIRSFDKLCHEKKLA